MVVWERGAKAFDAAVAAGSALWGGEPILNGLGGEMQIPLWDASRSRGEVICGQGPAPRSASIDAIRALGLNDIPGTGLLAACVPGAFAGWMTLLRDHGTWAIGDVMRFGIDYAGAGYPLAPRVVDTIAMVEGLFREHWPASAEVYLRGGVPTHGSSFRNPDLAVTYRRLVSEAESARGGREAQNDAALGAFYSGFVADAVDRHCREEFMGSSGPAHGGLLAGADLAAFKARHEAPVASEFEGWTVAKCGPWSQGPVFLQQLSMLDGEALAAAGFLSAWHVHRVTECAKLAFAERDAWYADPNFADVPLEDLLSRDYAAARRKLVADRASLELRPGAPGGRPPRLPPPSNQPLAEGHRTRTGAQPLGEERRATAHVAPRVPHRTP